MAMDKKKRVYASNVAVFLGVVTAIVVLVNLIGTRLFGRLDLTEARVYTLSPSSKDIVKNLPDYFTVKAFISENLPPEMKSLSRYVRDLLDEYRASSKGKLRFEAVDPAGDKKLEEEASSCGVNKLQVQKLESQRFEVGSYFLGLCLQYAGKTEAVGEIMAAEGLEYQLSSRIKRMTQRKRKIAITNGHGELDLQQGFSAIKHYVEQEFDTAPVNPSTGEIPDDADAVLVGGPKQAFDDKGRREIDKFIMKGKGAIFLVDGMTMSTPRNQGGMPNMPNMPKMGQANDAGLGDLLKPYGFNVGQDFVFDRKAFHGPVEVGGGQMRLRTAPMFVGVEMPRDKGKDFGVLAGINAVVFPYPSSVELVGPMAGGKPAQGRLWRLAESSPGSWKVTGFFFYSAEKPPEETKEKGPFGIGYAYEGPLKSAFAPAAAPGMSSPDGASGESKKPVRLVVVGDSDFASDEYVMLARSPILGLYSSGAQMLFNAIAWTLEDEALAPVRAKTITSRPIAVDSDRKVVLIKALNVAGLPLATILVGVVLWRLRLSRRLSQKLDMG